MIAAQCDMARPLTEKKNIDLESTSEPDLPPLRQDQSKVQQILNNLLSNAIKFTPEGGRITVAAQRDDAGDLLADRGRHGRGHRRETSRRSSRSSARARTAWPSGDAMTREYSGTGLGLSIVKELCKLLGGEVSLESELGKGSTFTVRLPWARTEQPRLDSSLAGELEQLTRPRPIDLAPQTPPSVSSSTSP